MPEEDCHRLVPEQNFVRIGKVLRPQGLRGEIRIEPYTAHRENILAYTRVFLSVSDEAEKREYTVVQARLEKTAAVLRFAECSSRNEAELLRGHSLWLHSQDLPQLGPDEFYLHTLMGKEARTAEGKVLGRVCAVIDTEAHAILVVRDGAHELLIPAVAAFINQIETESLVLTLPEGLLEMNAEL